MKTYSREKQESQIDVNTKAEKLYREIMLKVSELQADRLAFDDNKVSIYLSFDMWRVLLASERYMQTCHITIEDCHLTIMGYITFVLSPMCDKEHLSVTYAYERL